MSVRVRWAAGGGALMLAGLVAWWVTASGPGAAAPDAVEDSGAAGWGGVMAPSGAQADRFQTGLEALPASLHGTELDGEARADTQGQLVLDRRLRDLFDYFLSLVGEEPLPRVQARLVAYLQAQLPPAAAQQAQALLDRYIRYGEARGQLGQTLGSVAVPQADGRLSPEALGERLQAMRDLQQQYFSDDERQAFFGDDEVEDRYTVARVAVWQDTQLNALEKAQRLRELQQTLPLHLQQRLTAADAVTDLRALQADWQARGGTPDELRAARVALVGEAAADRLQALDAQRAAWAQRVGDYRTAAARIEQDATLSPALREQALAQLRQSAFTPAEWPRLDAALQMAGMPGAKGP